MFILQIAMTDEGGKLIADLAKRANLPNPEEFVRKAISILGVGVQIEELGGSITAHFPNGETRPIDCIADPDQGPDDSPLGPPPGNVRPQGSGKTPTDKLGWAAYGLKIIREQRDK